MRKFSEFKIGDQFFSTCSISNKELDEYLSYSRVKNAFLEDRATGTQKIISGRAILSRMEGEFTRLSQIYGNQIIFIGTDGDIKWENRNTRFLKSLHTDEVLKIKFTVSGKEDIDENYGKIAIDYEGTTQDGEIVVLSKKNLYRIKKDLVK
ncbi:MAG: hypothetical protein OEM18_01835 [Nitrosopumilus sp.]|nr:hypothetical protein [Nitrosopumilus sp.]MDH3502197.1 hypothetical protein [Nitrosopumilus sp.]